MFRSFSNPSFGDAGQNKASTSPPSKVYWSDIVSCIWQWAPADGTRCVESTCCTKDVGRRQFVMHIWLFFWSCLNRRQVATERAIGFCSAELISGVIDWDTFLFFLDQLPTDGLNAATEYFG